MHHKKALAPIVSTDAGKVISLNLSQNWKARSPISLILFEIVISLNAILLKPSAAKILFGIFSVQAYSIA